jgi:hypothetical protein
MALSDAAIRAAKPQEGRTVKLSDGGGLQLWVKPTGSKLWNIAYRYVGNCHPDQSVKCGFLSRAHAAAGGE